jgi:hypothetical protein
MENKSSLSKYKIRKISNNIKKNQFGQSLPPYTFVPKHLDNPTLPTPKMGIHPKSIRSASF